MNSKQLDELTKKSGIYPDFLTKEEKADIKSALLEHLKKDGYLPCYLSNLQIINAYPEADPQQAKNPVVVTVQINASQS